MDKDLQLLRRSAYAHTRSNRTYQACMCCRTRKLKCVSSEEKSGVGCIRCIRERRECVWTVARGKRRCEEILTSNPCSLRSVKRVEPASLKIIGPEILDLPVSIGVCGDRLAGIEIHDELDDDAVGAAAQGLPRYSEVDKLMGLDLFESEELLFFELEASTQTNNLNSLDMFDCNEADPFKLLNAGNETLNAQNTCGLAGRMTSAADIPRRCLLFDQWHSSFEGISKFPFQMLMDICTSDLFPSHFLNDKSQYLSSAGIIEIRQRLLRSSVDDRSRPTFARLNECSRYLWDGIEILMKHAQVLIFPSEAQTVAMIETRSYREELQKFKPRLRGWKRDLDKLNLPPAVRLVLLIEFEYVKVYINSIVLQAMLGAANTATTFVEEDWKAIRTLTTSCRTITKLIARGLQLEMLLHCSPARCYLRGLGATTFLLKASSLSANLDEAKSNLEVLLQGLINSRTCESGQKWAGINLSSKLENLIVNLYGDYFGGLEVKI
ncbi:hypothetical protein L207DRAFT_562800 [Hyaloscypha variabilis F]|uniref:Zn(2)-C6 fungal-type domain-containing protein n=1 Tax=Hyaloscypha variabilis (strain UAMH 11265 / GT02V1 / F) TaxID=1149755 RepID=A0A2J6S4I6_HYAVF|nr:hypothetical protein L207DRAFT_562800 [Hyaloscypha variabilis F]